MIIMQSHALELKLLKIVDKMETTIIGSYLFTKLIPCR